MPLTNTHKAIFTFGATLEVELITQNSDQRAFSITEALHTYFAVSDVRDIKVVGLDGCSYADKVDGGKLKQQRSEITFVGETDAVYFNTKSECEIVDNKWKRKIHIQKRGSQSTVVWNPWRDKSASMGDMPEEGYLQMLCVETANALNDSVTVKPGEEHRLWMSVNVKK